jgi:hypothetical protein
MPQDLLQATQVNSMPHAVNGEAVTEGVRMDVLAYLPCILIYELPDPLLRYWE